MMQLVLKPHNATCHSFRIIHVSRLLYVVWSKCAASKNVWSNEILNCSQVTNQEKQSAVREQTMLVVSPPHYLDYKEGDEKFPSVTENV
jgi:hypothetical protein